jgi:PIN domain-containing protein
LTLVFFTDRDLGTLFPEILKRAGLEVERHRDHFPPECPDEDWLAEVGRREWVALTHDYRIRYKPNELAAVIRHRVRLLVIVGKAPFPDLAASFVATRSRVEAFLKAASAPVIAKVYRATPVQLADNPAAAGRIEHWYPK